MNTEATSARSHESLLWWSLATLLIIFGFAIDGASAAGHHAGLILGGIAIGLGIARAK